MIIFFVNLNQLVNFYFNYVKNKCSLRFSVAKFEISFNFDNSFSPKREFMTEYYFLKIISQNGEN